MHLYPCEIISTIVSSVCYELAKFHFLLLFRQFKNAVKLTMVKSTAESMESNSTGKFRSLLLTVSSISGISFLLMLNKSSLSWITGWFRWCPTSAELQEQAELKMFSYLKSPVELSFVMLPSNNESEEWKVRSLVTNKDAKATPVVLLHGFASGIGLWILNIDWLSQDRPLYALDILGFGRSSRPAFSKDAAGAEDQFVESIEQWRKQVGLNQFILLGHSMGGFLASSYAIKYPERIKHLILADPWGFPSPDLSVKKIQLPLWVKIIARMLRPFNPLAGLRAAGPLGPRLVKRLRPDILRKYEIVEDPTDVSNYIYHSNAQHPSGEAAFKAMCAEFGWAKQPMIERISELRQDVPISFIYGARSWVDSTSGLATSAIRKDSYVQVKIIEGAGHHVYADRTDKFNETVCEICRKAETLSSSSYSSLTASTARESLLNDADILC